MEMSFAAIKARIAEEVEAGERRRASRVDVGIDARVRPLGEEGCEATVLNLSDTGFMATSEGDYRVGSRIWLMVPGRDRRNAVVKWVAGHRFGAEFAEPRAMVKLL
ncbi:PilZ domain-containing protein [Sphingomonas sp.]|uniref:PilZ domain-containing protein n=1 Tax=Sphingomonas sp. TaxID=28214 RepID=UPI00286A8058|nr:PilZ domain-containing protein [Sphingomonas sp.]